MQKDIEAMSMRPAAYLRRSSSPRSERLLSLSKQMHELGEGDAGRPAERTFAGLNCLPQADHIRALVLHTGARTLLDYGSGEGRQYEQREVRGCDGNTSPNLQTYWGVDSITCYDSAFVQFSTSPQGTLTELSRRTCSSIARKGPSLDRRRYLLTRPRILLRERRLLPAAKRLARWNAHCPERIPGAGGLSRISHRESGAVRVPFAFRP